MTDVSIPGTNYQLRTGNDGSSTFVSPDGTTLTQDQFLRKVESKEISLTSNSLQFLDSRLAPVTMMGLRAAAPELSAPLVTPNSQNLNNLLARLGSGEGDVSLLMEQLQKVQKDIGDQQVTTQTEGVNVNKARIDSNVNAQLQKIQEAGEKLKADQGWETAKKVFMVAGAILGLIGAIAGAIASGGVGIPGAIAIGVAAVGLISTCLEVTGAMDAMMKDLSPEAQIGIRIGIAVLLLAGAATSIGTSIAGVGQAAAKVSSEVVTLGAKVAMTAQQTTNALAGSTFGLVVQGISYVSQGAGGLMKIGEGIGTGVRGSLQYEVAQIDDQKKGFERDNVRIKKQQQDLMDAIRDLIKQLDEGVKITTQVIEGQSTLNAKLIRQNI